MSRVSWWIRGVVLAALTTGVPAVASAQTSLPCSAPPELVGDLGILSTECKQCFVTGKHVPGVPDIEFATEPVLVDFRRGGPSDGKLNSGDILVAVNNQLITTQAAALLYSWPTPGKPLRLTVRRSGTIRDVEITPAPKCLAVTPGTVTLFSFNGRLGPDFRAFLAAPVSPNRGTFGITLSGTLPLSRALAFSAFPEVLSVASDSPAEKGGLRTGDVLVAMDGVSLRSREGTLAFRDIKPGQKVVLTVLRDADALLKLTVITGPPR